MTPTARLQYYQSWPLIIDSCRSSLINLVKTGSFAMFIRIFTVYCKAFQAQKHAGSVVMGHKRHPIFRQRRGIPLYYSEVVKFPDGVNVYTVYDTQNRSVFDGAGSVTKLERCVFLAGLETV